MNVKRCSKCTVVQDLAQFSRDKGAPDGFYRWCKYCKKQQRVNKILANKSRSIEEQFPSGTKTCTRCSQEMELSQFNKVNGTLRSNCKACKKEKYSLLKRARQDRSEDEINSDRRKKLKVNDLGVFVKTCSVCQKSKPTSEFSKDTVSLDALLSQCKTCAVARASERYQEAQALQSDLKEGKQCENCSNADTALLEFAHLDRKDKYRNSKGRTVSVSRMQNRSTILKEVAKCKLLCRVCHRLETKLEYDAKSKNTIAAKPGVRKKQEFVNLIKMTTGSCQDCTLIVTQSNTIAFDFDHLDATTKVDCVSKMIYTTRTLDEIQAEIQKCELVCANCHQKRSNRRLQSAKLQATLSAQESALLST